MKSAPHQKKPVAAESIARRTDAGNDVSRFFTNTGKMHFGIATAPRLRDNRGMASTTLIPVSEYLSTTYRPDRDYIDGELKERNLGEQPHAHLQAIFAAIFRENRKTWSVRPLTEQRIQVSSSHYRVADVCILRSSDPHDPVIHTAPLLCIEILSKGDTLSELQERVDDYQSMGIQNIWIIDPWKRHGYIATTRGFEQPLDGMLAIPNTPIRIALRDVFAELDEIA